MSDDQENTTAVDTNEDEQTNENSLSEKQEKELLLTRAKLLGLNPSNNTGLPKLRQMVEEAQEKEEKQVESKDGQTDEAENPIRSANRKKNSLRRKLQQEQLRMIRVRVSNLDPKKNSLRGEYFTIANEYLGTIRKFVPYGEATDNGYHIPYCIYNMLKARKFLSVKSRTGDNGRVHVEQRWVREFSLEMMDPLTKEELEELANAQRARGDFEPAV